MHLCILSLKRGSQIDSLLDWLWTLRAHEQSLVLWFWLREAEAGRKWTAATRHLGYRQCQQAFFGEQSAKDLDSAPHHILSLSLSLSLIERPLHQPGHSGSNDVKCLH